MVIVYCSRVNVEIAAVVVADPGLTLSSVGSSRWVIDDGHGGGGGPALDGDTTRSGWIGWIDEGTCEGISPQVSKEVEGKHGIGLKIFDNCCDSEFLPSEMSQDDITDVSAFQHH
jgi:hypothetical protein